MCDTLQSFELFSLFIYHSNIETVINNQSCLMISKISRSEAHSTGRLTRERKGCLLKTHLGTKYDTLFFYRVLGT